LEHPSCVRVDYHAPFLYADEFVSIAQVRDLMYAEAVLGELAGRVDEAAESYLNCVRLADTVSRGGLWDHSIEGEMARRTGARGLSRIRKSLAAARCRTLIARLQSLEHTVEPIGQVYARDAIWDQRHGSWVARVSFLTLPIYAESAAGRDRVRNVTIALLRLCVCSLALQIYKTEHGSLPEQLDDLVPECLTDVPVDPFTGDPLIYLRGDSGCRLYSVGADGVDNGGIPAPFGHPRDDPGEGTDILLPL
jgi:hypothetical protein